MKEYGGYLPLEIYGESEYYSGQNVYRFNCARSAIRKVIRSRKIKKIYLPYYLCESVRRSLEDEVDVFFYHIDENFLPQLGEVESDTAVLITNYFGIKRNTGSYVRRFENVIFDNTQAFFEPPISGAYNVYSCRKFFGVADGAYLVSDLIGLNEEDNNLYTPLHARYLLDAVSFSSNYGYSESLENEKQIEVDGIRGMSRLSKSILCGINYTKVKKRRKENFAALHSCLKTINDFEVDQDDDTFPMVYPFMYRKRNIRSKLVERKIYVPQWWKYLLSETKINDVERVLSSELLPLPIDQRYTTDDMGEMSQIISEVCSK